MGIKDEVWEVHLNHYPEEESLLKPFLAGFDVTFGRKRRAQNTELSVYFIKPHEHTKEAFGFEQELLLVYSKFQTMEPRAIQAAEQILHEDPARGRVDRLTYIVISEMSSVDSWIRDYVSRNQESRLIAAFCADNLRNSAGDAWYVRNELTKQYYGRDLFDFRLPIEQDLYFFGREAEVLTYRDAIKRGENRGIFGLRKTGKTSFLFKVERLLKSENLAAVIYVDCKSPAIRSQRWYELISYLSRKIFGEHSSNTPKNTSIPAIAEWFSDAVKVATRQLRLVLIFDEIEYISPLAQLDAHWREDFLPFWQTVWSCQSRYRGMSAILAGVNPTVTEQSVYNNVQNPLFGIVSSQYLCGLKLEETKRMVRTLGKRMGLDFKPDAIDYLQMQYGGHPLLTRIACSYHNNFIARTGKAKPTVITRSILQGEEVARDRELSFYCEHVVSELRQFYSDEYSMLEMLARKQLGDFVEFAALGSSVKHLREYGLLDYKGGMPFVTVPVIESYVATCGTRREPVPPIEREKWVRQRIEDIIKDLRLLERRIDSKSLPSLFGPNSFPEADKLAVLSVVRTEADFTHFINVMNRCLIESVERFGKFKGDDSYFWSLRASYPALFEVLERIKVYRHDAVHKDLLPQVKEKLASFLKEDLSGSDSEEKWFVLQQRLLDRLFASVQVESARLG